MFLSFLEIRGAVILPLAARRRKPRETGWLLTLYDPRVGPPERRLGKAMSVSKVPASNTVFVSSLLQASRYTHTCGVAWLRWVWIPSATTARVC